MRMMSSSADAENRKAGSSLILTPVPRPCPCIYGKLCVTNRDSENATACPHTRFTLRNTQLFSRQELSRCLVLQGAGPPHFPSLSCCVPPSPLDLPELRWETLAGNLSVSGGWRKLSGIHRELENQDLLGSVSLTSHL